MLHATCTKAGHCIITQPFKQQIEIIYKLENTICTTLVIKLTLLDVANGKAVCRMSQVSPPPISKKIPMLQLCSSPSPFHVLIKILIYAMPNADYHRIDLNVPYTKHRKYHF